MFSVKKRAQPTVAGAAFLCSLSEDPRKADADGSWPPASVRIFPDAHLLRRCGMVHCHSRRLTRRPSTPRNPLSSPTPETTLWGSSSDDTASLTVMERASDILKQTHVARLIEEA